MRGYPNGRHRLGGARLPNDLITRTKTYIRLTQECVSSTGAPSRVSQCATPQIGGTSQLGLTHRDVPSGPVGAALTASTLATIEDEDDDEYENDSRSDAALLAPSSLLL